MGGLSWAPCLPWWQTYFSADTLSNGFFAILGALVGAIAGGIASYYVQKQTLVEQREDRRQQETELLKERVMLFVMATQRIRADMENIQGLLLHYRETNNPQYDLWQVVHTINFTPGLKPDLAQLECLSRFGSATIVRASMWLFSEYASLTERIEEYNGLRISYVADRSDPKRNPTSLEVDQKNMQNLVVFIDRTSAAMIAEADNCFRLVHKHSVLKFGSAKFIELKEDDDIGPQIGQQKR